MFTKVERLISSRNLRPKKKEGFLKIISIFSFLGIMLGVAILIIVITFQDYNNQQTETGSMIFFYSRILHYFIYVFGVPYFRTLSFVASWIGLLIISVPLLSFIF